MGIRQWFNKAASKARKGLFKTYKKRWAEKRDRKKQRELERELDVAMTRTPLIEQLPQVISSKPLSDLDDDWFVPALPATPKG